ncbi:MAG: hypothetical protein OZ921_07880 [Sorangiineae bacterium]|nr:hypothetical protein [Polyangiaceae bacterium]MEB2322416.1 hypothetical protein [Sorangiineae bacterium]
MSGRRASVALAVVLTGCCRAAPPSQFPSADDALDRMRASYACSRGVQGEAKLDYFGKEGRVRGNVLYLAALPDQLRFDVFSPFGAIISTLTSDGRDFALYDLRNKQFLHGPASTCNVARFTQVPVPPFALAQLLRGEAPVLVHSREQSSIEWSCGKYVIHLDSTRDAHEELHLEPLVADWDRPWQEQRVRVREVAVSQKGTELYRAVLDGHAPARTAGPLVDPDGLDPDVPPSGPACTAEIPRRIRLEVPGTEQDLILIDEEVAHNPPLIEGAFRQSPPPGVSVAEARCTD